VEAGRGSPHDGVYLSFQHCPERELRAAFGPVIDRLAANNIDLTRMPVEVAPIAHYHMGGVRADARMQTEVPGLFVSGEVVGGANGANRLSGNAITEALVFGRRAGRSAAARANGMRSPLFAPQAVRPILSLLDGGSSVACDVNTAEMVQALQKTMWDEVGPLRTRDKLSQALVKLDSMTRQMGELPPGGGRAFDLQRCEWLDLRNMLLVARVVTLAALRRTESRGAHQREDFPASSPDWELNQLAYLRGDEVQIGSSSPTASEPAR
jgi:succinate dehydrogenase/fumarate reductase flavoprotein subunit